MRIQLPLKIEVLDILANTIWFEMNVSDIQLGFERGRKDISENKIISACEALVSEGLARQQTNSKWWTITTEGKDVAQKNRQKILDLFG